MEEIFVKLLNMSISAGILILIVALLRLVLRKAPRWMVCLLWALVAVRLICPVNFTSPVSAYQVIDPPVTEQGEIEFVHYSGGGERPLAVLDREDYSFLRQDLKTGSDDKHTNNSYSRHDPDIYLPPVVLIWEVGAVFLLLYALASFLKLSYQLRDSVCYAENIWMNDNVKTPFILGIIRPKIYLNSSTKQEQLEYVVAHEQAHIRRRDSLWKLIGYVLLCIYWFQPLCWLAYFLFCKDIELACDEKVIRDKNLEWKKTYSMTLLECSMQKKKVLACPLAFSEVGVKDRVSAVLKYKKPAVWIVVAAAVLGVVTAVCFLTVPSKAGMEEVLFTFTDVSDGRTHPEYGEGSLFLPVEDISADGRTQVQEADDWHSYNGGVSSGIGKEAASNAAWDMEIVSNAGSSEVPSQEVLDEPADGTGNAAKNDGEGKIKLVLYDAPQPDKVCIRVQPSTVRERLSYYYIPEDGQEELIKAVNDLNVIWNRSGKDDKFWHNLKETGWTVCYGNAEYLVFEGGYFYSHGSYDVAEGLVEFLKQDEALYGQISQMLADIRYTPVDVTQIKDIVSARLEVSSSRSGLGRQTRIVTDKEALAKMEKWFREANYIFGGADCCNQEACLELTLADGRQVNLSLATDSCPNFGVNGVYYDYRPARYQGEKGFDSDELFRLFGIRFSDTSEVLQTMAYIREFSGDRIRIDAVEWVEVPGSRAKELGITEDDAPGGFEVYNEAESDEEYVVAPDCTITVLDWENSYQRKEVSRKEAVDLLKYRNAWNPNIPYILTFENGRLANIEEQYIP